MQSAPALKADLAFLFLFVGSLAAVGLVSAQQKSASRTGPSRAGWISDESCGAQHTKTGRADCVQKCWRGLASVGAPGLKPQQAVLIARDHRPLLIFDHPYSVASLPAVHPA